MTQACFIETSKYEEEVEKKQKRRLNVSRVLELLGVSRTGYYSFQNKKPSERHIKKDARMETIRSIYAESHKIYGAPKIAAQMRKNGECISDKTVGNYMREMNLRACYVKKTTCTTMHSDFSQKLQNILNEDFNPEKPNAVWCSDITYIWTYTGFVYLTSIMDLYSRKIISWVISDTLETKYVIEAIEKAKKERKVEKPKIMHSDRGIQYTCSAYMEATKNWNRSYSKKAYPWDNACMESFHSLLKREWLNRFRIVDLSHAHTLVFEYINTFYNTVRIHSHCDYESPQEHEKRYLEELEKKVREVG